VPRQKSTTDDERFPLWFNLPRRFFERLAAAHEEFGVSRTKLMMRGLELVIKEEEAKRAGEAPDAKRPPVSEKSLSDALRRVAEMRWQATSEEERKQVGRKLAEARWGKNRLKKTGKS
jgi:hypothetical protein